jgi:phenylpropionate dioxygenase-like ring-hydroxylating dioxygenase large terminal subunit
MLINNWYVAATSAEVARDKPLGVRMLGCDFVLMRDEAGKTVCLSDVCCHRGASLARGEVCGGRVACPYHGWEFGPDGACTSIPLRARRRSSPRRCPGAP